MSSIKSISNSTIVAIRAEIDKNIAQINSDFDQKIASCTVADEFKFALKESRLHHQLNVFCKEFIKEDAAAQFMKQFNELCALKSRKESPAAQLREQKEIECSNMRFLKASLDTLDSNWKAFAALDSSVSGYIATGCGLLRQFAKYIHYTSPDATKELRSIYHDLRNRVVGAIFIYAASSDNDKEWIGVIATAPEFAVNTIALSTMPIIDYILNNVVRMGALIAIKNSKFVLKKPAELALSPIILEFMKSRADPIPYTREIGTLCTRLETLSLRGLQKAAEIEAVCTIFDELEFLYN